MLLYDAVNLLRAMKDPLADACAFHLSGISKEDFHKIKNNYIPYLIKLTTISKVISPAGLISEFERRGLFTITKQSIRKKVVNQLAFEQSELFRLATMEDGSPLSIVARLAYNRSLRIPMYASYYIKFLKNPKASLYKRGLMTAKMNMWLIEHCNAVGNMALKDTILYKK